MPRYTIRYQGAPYGLNEIGHVVATAETIADLDRLWVENGCNGSPYDYVIEGLGQDD